MKFAPVRCVSKKLVAPFVPSVNFICALHVISSVFCLNFTVWQFYQIGPD